MRSVRSRHGVAALLSVALVSAGLVGCEPAPVVELTVTTTDDLVDRAPGDGVCEATAGAGDCSLRAAVMEANATPDVPTVRVILAAGASYVLTLQDTCDDEETIDATVGDLDVTRSLAIVGNGATLGTDGGVAADPTYGTVPCGFRALENHSGHLAVDDLTLSGRVWRGSGAALLNRSTAQLTDVTATGTGYRGGVVLDSTGNLTLVRTSVYGGGAYGTFDVPGEPWAAIWSRTGSLVLVDSRVRSNVGVPPMGSRDFAGIHVASGSATILQSVVTGHRAWVACNCPVLGDWVNGDGIDARVPVRISGSTIVANGTARDVVGGAAVEAGGSIMGSCPAPVTSLGYNSDSGGVCLGVGHPTDLAATPTTYANTPVPQQWVPAAGAAVVDAIPSGTAGLCAGWPTDIRGTPRPSGGGCDIGAVERQPTDP